VLTVATSVESRLEVDPAYCWMLNSKLNDLANFVLVDAALNCRDQSHR
jgi:hypothetical protein